MGMRRIPFINLKAQYLSIKEEIKAALERVLESGVFTLGEEVGHFEKEFAQYCGARYCVALNSGTSALHLALLALGIKEGDEVLTTAYSFIAPAEAVSYTGAKPVFVDIDPLSFNIDVSRIRGAITKKTKAILPVHLYGEPSCMDRLLEVASEYGLAVVEDACQAHGAECLLAGEWKKVGTLGDIGCFSFYPTKNLAAFGEGGAVVTDNVGLYEKIRMLRNHGQKGKDYHPFLGYNYRMTAFQGAILRVKLKRLNSWIEARRRKARLYSKLLEGTSLVIPKEARDSRAVYHQYVVRTPKRDELRGYLEERGIETGLYYPLPIPLQEAYSSLGHKKGDFPAAEACAQECLSLPLYPELGEEDIEYICYSIREWAKSSEEEVGESFLPKSKI